MSAYSNNGNLLVFRSTDWYRGLSPEQIQHVDDNRIVPTVLNELLSSKDAAKSQRVMESMLKMVKRDIKKLKVATKGK